MTQHNVAEQPLVRPDTLPTKSWEVQPVPLARGGTLHADLRRTLLLALLFAFPASLSIPWFARGQYNPDLWWHLRTGAWIIQHHSLPWTDPYSAFGMGKPWFAYSWLYELFLYGAYHWCGLVGTAVGVMLLATVNGLVLYGAIRKRMGGFAAPVGLAALGIFVLLGFYTAMPVLVSIICFVIEIDILFGELVGKPDRFSPRRIWILPVLFVLWANVHVEFFYGLAVLVFAAAAQDLGIVSGPKGLRIAVVPNKKRYRLWTVTVVSALATLLNPYTWRVYEIVLQLAHDQTPFKLISELKAPDFRSPADYILIFTILAAGFVLGRVRLRGSLFAGILLAGCTVISLRAVHDEWAVLIVALLVIAEGCPKVSSRHIFAYRQQEVLAGILAVVLVFGYAHRRGLSNSLLQKDAAKDFPVGAADFVLRENLRGPLFNDFNWGGYLIWKLPNLPVAIDGRTNLYGDSRIERSFRTWNCAPGWKNDPDLAAANLIIGSTKSPLTYALQGDASYRIVYRDDTSVVLVRRARCPPPRSASPNLQPIRNQSSTGGDYCAVSQSSRARTA